MIRTLSRPFVPGSSRSASLLSAFVLLSVASSQVGCSKSESASSTPMAEQAAAANAATSESFGKGSALGGTLSARVGAAAPALASPTPAAGKDAPGAATDATSQQQQQRRVIKKADLALEAKEPSSVEAAVTSIVAARGGFVVGADTKHTALADGTDSAESTIEFRVPAATFDSTLIAIRSLPGHITNENVTGTDVTEEYTDLQSRLVAKHALEAQYLVILKEAHSIPDILAVQEKLGEVRTDIEHAEGRRRFLENQSDLSTFTLHVTQPVAPPKPPPPPEPEGTGFGKSLKAAGHDALDISVAIINGLIRTVGALLPFVVIFGLPLYIAGRLYWRRRQRKLTPPNE